MTHTHLLVDFAGVIGRNQQDRDLEDMADVLSLPVDAFLRRYWEHRVAYDLGLGDATYWDRVATRILDPAIVDQLVALDRRSWIRLNLETVEVLADHHRAGSRLTLLSNAPHFLADAVTDLAELWFFDSMTFSCGLGVAKPDPEAFARALSSAGASAEETIFIDDRKENVEAAESLGIRSVLFADAPQLERSLALVSQRL